MPYHPESTPRYRSMPDNLLPVITSAPCFVAVKDASTAQRTPGNPVKWPLMVCTRNGQYVLYRVLCVVVVHTKLEQYLFLPKIFSHNYCIVFYLLVGELQFRLHNVAFLPSKASFFHNFS